MPQSAFSHRRGPTATITLGSWSQHERSVVLEVSSSKTNLGQFFPASLPVLQNPVGSLGLQLQSVALRYDGTLVRHTNGAPFGSRHPQIGQCHSDAEVADNRDPRLIRLEAILFLARQPLPSRKLAKLARLIDGTEARTLIKTLNHSYDAFGRAFRAEEVAGGYQLRTRSQIAPWLRRMATAPAEIRMSGPAMETLAVVAYRQPVMRAEIEKIRGVQCGEILRQLMERNMVRIAGRADELGRPFLYGTTRTFLEVFGLRSLDELPRASMLRAGGVHGDDSASSTEKDGCDEEEIEESSVRAKDPTEEAKDPTVLKSPQEMLAEEPPDQDDDIDDLEDDDMAGEDEEDDGFSDEEWEEVEDESTDGDEEDEQWEDEDEEWDDALDDDSDEYEDEQKDIADD